MSAGGLGLGLPDGRRPASCHSADPPHLLLLEPTEEGGGPAHRGILRTQMLAQEL